MYILQESTHFTHFVAIYAYFYVTLGRSAQIITILHRGGSAETPKLYYVIYEQPLRRVERYEAVLVIIVTKSKNNFTFLR